MPASNTSGESPPNFEELISLKAAAKLSGLSKEHLRRLASQGQLWAKKMGRDWVTTEVAVRAYLARGRRPGPKVEKE